MFEHCLCVYEIMVDRVRSDDGNKEGQLLHAFPLCGVYWFRYLLQIYVLFGSVINQFVPRWKQLAWFNLFAYCYWPSSYVSHNREDLYLSNMHHCQTHKLFHERNKQSRQRQSHRENIFKNDVHCFLHSSICHSESIIHAHTNDAQKSYNS
jgi:hypothetical protein